MWLLLFSLVAATHAYGLELKNLSIEYRRFVGVNYLLEIPNFNPKEGLTLNMDLDLLGPVYWNNRIISFTDGGGYKYVAWNFFLGLRIFKTLSVQFEHYSGHELDHDDAPYYWGHFPVYDDVGLVWVLAN